MTATTEARRVNVTVSNAYGCREKLKDMGFAYDAANKTWSRQYDLRDGWLCTDSGARSETIDGLPKTLGMYDRSRKFSIEITDVAGAACCG